MRFELEENFLVSNHHDFTLYLWPRLSEDGSTFFDWQLVNANIPEDLAEKIPVYQSRSFDSFIADLKHYILSHPSFLTDNLDDLFND